MHLVNSFPVDFFLDWPTSVSRMRTPLLLSFASTQVRTWLGCRTSFRDRGRRAARAAHAEGNRSSRWCSGERRAVSVGLVARRPHDATERDREQALCPPRLARSEESGSGRFFFLDREPGSGSTYAWVGGDRSAERQEGRAACRWERTAPREQSAPVTPPPGSAAAVAVAGCCGRRVRAPCHPVKGGGHATDEAVSCSTP